MNARKANIKTKLEKQHVFLALWDTFRTREDKHLASSVRKATTRTQLEKQLASYVRKEASLAQMGVTCVCNVAMGNTATPRAVPSVLVAHLAKRQIVWVHKIVHIVKKVHSNPFQALRCAILVKMDGIN